MDDVNSFRTCNTLDCCNDKDCEACHGTGFIKPLVASPQVQERVKVKRNRGLKRDILKLLAVNPNISPIEVFEALKSNVYGGSSSVSLNTVMSTMSQLKGRKLRCVCGNEIEDKQYSVCLGCHAKSVGCEIKITPQP
jgi:hypothetical protein